MTEIIDLDRHFSHRDLSRIDGKIKPRRLGSRAAVRRDDPCGEYLGSNANRGGIEARAKPSAPPPEINRATPRDHRLG